MSIERAAGGSSQIDVLDRVLDKGIVIDAWLRLSLVGIDLVTVEASVVVASIATYLQFSEPLGVSSVVTSSAARPPSVAESIKAGSVTRLTNTTTTDGHRPDLGRGGGG
jgi:hypothetical protein